MNTQNAIQEISEEIFSVVKEKVDAKVDKADIGYFEIDITQIQTEPPTITLTSSQLTEINKKYCIVKILGTTEERILYKSANVDEEQIPFTYFHSLAIFNESQNVVTLEILEMKVNMNTGVALFNQRWENHYTATGSDNKYQTLSNLRTSFQSTPDDTHYPSEKLVKDNLDGKQPTIDSSHKLSSSLVDDTNSNNKFVPPYTEETFEFVLKDGTTVEKTFFIKTPTNNN